MTQPTDDLASQMVREIEETPKELAEAELIVTALRAWGSAYLIWI